MINVYTKQSFAIHAHFDRNIAAYIKASSLACSYVDL